MNTNNIPKSFLINNINVYLAEDIYNYDTEYFPGCSVRLRNIIDKKRLIEDVHYMYGYYSKTNNLWIKSKSTYPKAKLLLLTDYVENNVPKFKKNIDTNINDYKYDIVPEELFLIDEEKFKNIDGKIINIEVRGEQRKHNKCYFKMKDVSEGFELPNLYSTLLHKNSNYEENYHYKYFTVKNMGTTHKDKDKNNKHNIIIKHEIYLTYLGILTVLFNSKSNYAKSFQDWACEKLFTIQMGEQEDKVKLSSKMIGMDLKTLKTLLGCNSYDKTPCIYLFYIEQANKLLKTDKYKENDIVCKFGYTKDLKQRFTDHQQHYTKLFNNDDLKLELITFSIVDVFHLSAAENKLYTLFEDKKLEYGNEQELIILDKTKINKIKDYYNMIQKTYIGSYQELYDQINELKQQLKDIQKDKDNEINLLKEIHTRELLEEKNKLILKEKEIELLNIRYENQLLVYKVKLLENGIKIN